MEYFGYNFFFASFLAGPAVTYKQYLDFISGANFTSVKPPKSDEVAVNDWNLSMVPMYYFVG